MGIKVNNTKIRSKGVLPKPLEKEAMLSLEKATRIAQMFLAAKNIERIGDQSTNIAELIIFAQTGEVIEDSRVKIDESAL